MHNRVVRRDMVCIVTWPVVSNHDNDNWDVVATMFCVVLELMMEEVESPHLEIGGVDCSAYHDESCSVRE